MKSDGENSGGGLPPLAERCLLIFAVNQRLNFEAENSTNAPLCCRGFSAMIELQEAETRALAGHWAKHVAEKYRLSVRSMMCAGGCDETGAQWEGNDTPRGFYEMKNGLLCLL